MIAGDQVPERANIEKLPGATKGKAVPLRSTKKPVVSRGLLLAVPLTQVQITDEFWKPRLETNRRVTIPFSFDKCQGKRIGNFARVSYSAEGEFEGNFYDDSDLYKVIEGGPNAVTVTAWINTTSTETGTIVGWGPNTAGQRFGFRINANRLRLEHQGGNIQGDTTVTDGQWHHIAVTVQESATISYPEVVLYLNGIDDTRPSTDPDAFALIAGEDVRIGSRPSNDDRFFMGQIDDVRIYDYALSDAEISWLAGRTQPFDKPF